MSFCLLYDIYYYIKQNIMDKFKNELKRYQILKNGTLVETRFSTFNEIAVYVGCTRSYIHIQFKKNKSTQFNFKKNIYKIIGI